MKHSMFTRVLAMLLVLVMVVGLVPAAVLATETDGTESTESNVSEIIAPEENPSEPVTSEEEDLTQMVFTGAENLPVFYVNGFVSETHDVFSRTESIIAPGVTQSINYAYSKDGKQMAYYVATADIRRDDVMVQASYFNQFENQTFGMSKLTDQMAYADALFTNEEKDSFISEYYKAVAGVNGDFYNMSTGQPSGAFVINGVQSSNKANNRPWFAIFEDGAALCGANNAEWDAAVAAHGAVQQAVGGSQMLVVNGKDVTANATGSYNTDRHSRTCVGVTADGQVVMMVLDGRQEPFSCGGTMHELAQIMLEQGCVAAINLDGGGSTTFAARQEGENDISLVNRPSDGSERSISSALIIASLAAPSNVFDRAVLTAENEYVTPYSTVNVTAAGVSPAGTAAQIPDNAVWQLADDSLGTVENGVFTSNGTVGEAVVQLAVDGVVVGQTTINVVIPDITFDTAVMTVPFNKTFKLTVSGTTNGGLNKVVLKDSDLVFELSDPAMGTIDGAYYTSCDDTAGIAGGTITVKCVYDTRKTDTATVTFGKASVIAEDFEDGNIDGWSAKSGYANPDKGDPTFGRFESFDLRLVDASTGKVRNGNYALEIFADFTTTTASGYKAIKYSFPAIDLTGATTFGMWMYLPVADVHNLEFDIGGYEYYIEDDANVGDEGWYYITAPAATVGSSVSTFTIYMTDPDNTYFNIFNQFSIYVDDLTIDYSNATEDRELPEFSKVTVVTGLDSETAMNGQVHPENVITVKAYAAENTMIGNYTGLDISTAKVYVDGVALSSSAYYCDERGVINVGDLFLADGTHSFRFEIKDKAGNTGFVTKKIVINTADGDVYLTRRSDVPQPLAGSVDYYDVIANNIEKIDSLTMTIDLDTLNKWEFEGADVAYGFALTYSVDSRSNTATITITRTGDVEATGKATLVAIPVRVWSTSSYLMPKYIDAGVVSNDPGSNESKVISTPYVMWQTDRTRLVRIEMAVESAMVGYTDGSTTTFASLPINVITEHNRYRTEGYYTAEGNYVKGDVTFCKQGKESLHVHSEAVAMADKEATCTTAGYTGRTYCEECNSVIDWGTTIPAAGHIYELVDGALKCTCGKLLNGEQDGKLYVDGVIAQGWIGETYYVDGVKLTGIQQADGFYYDFGEDGICEGQAKYTGLIETNDGVSYAKFGELVTGWVLVGDDNYYFGEDYKAVGGTDVRINGYIYSFDENYVLVKGMWTKDSQGRIRYVWADKAINNEFREIEGKLYCFNAEGYLLVGDQYVRFVHGDPYTMYYIGEDGAVAGKMEGFTGLHKSVAGVFMVVDGEAINAGLVKDDEGNYYYINSSRKAVVSCAYGISEDKANGLLPAGRYEFDAEGKMINPPVQPENPGQPDQPDIEVKQGLVVDEDGEIRYYVDGIATYAGLVQDDEGNYYYINSSKKAVKDCAYGVGAAKTNDLLPAGVYNFGADGKMINPPTAEPDEPDIEVKQGLVVDEDGEIRYYVDGVATYAGLVQDDEGNYYYINSSKKAVKDCAYGIGAAKTNDLLPAGVYNFGADGKMINPPTAEPDEPDIEVKQGLVVDEDGEIRYYVDGVATYAGLVQDDEGNYYYINSSKKAVKDCIYGIGAAKTNGLLDAGKYQFGADGKMINPPVV